MSSIEEQINKVECKKESMDRLFKAILKSKSFRELVEPYASCKTEDIPEFIFAGIGKNWYICQKVVKTFLSMGLHAQALDCGHALHGDLGMLSGNKTKILCFISRSGTTEELVKVAKITRSLISKKIFNDIKMVGFFLNKNCPNKEIYDSLIIPDDLSALDSILEFDDRNLVPSLSIDVCQLVLDSMGVMIYEGHDDLVEKYVYNHLGGANGAKLGSSKILEKIS